ncbi:alanine racemase [Nitriliruptoraceae bacterium ZYF776]|nr:alanine racemase [Profundirhabdus halotolerans]
MTRWRPTRAIVDLAAVRHNVARLREVAGTEVCAVVKADGYGHGAVEVARAALTGGASWLAVALLEEGQHLRAAGIDAPVLVLSEPPPAAVPALVDAELTPTVYRTEMVAALDAEAARRGVHLAVHLKVDTGMGRVGVPLADWAPRCRELLAADHLDVDAIWTHLARADEPGAPTTDDQLDRFDRALAVAADLGLRPRLVHAANTAGTLLHPRSRRDLVRPGIGIYGLSPGVEVDAADHGLRPALSLVSEVSYVKRVTAGTPLSYGHRFAAPADGWVATVPIGYADGVPRTLTGRAEVLLGGRRRPVAGTITMDQLLVWCGEDPPEVGDEVVLLGAQGDERIRVEAWAQELGTITYEVPTQLTARVPREVR